MAVLRGSYVLTAIPACLDAGILDPFVDLVSEINRALQYIISESRVRLFVKCYVVFFRI